MPGCLPGKRPTQSAESRSPPTTTGRRVRVPSSPGMPDTGVAIVGMDKPSLTGSRDLCPVRWRSSSDGQALPAAGKTQNGAFPDRLMRSRTLAGHGGQNSNRKQRDACDRSLRLRDRTQDGIRSPDESSAPNHGPVTWAASIDRTDPHENKKRDNGDRGPFASHDHHLSGGYDHCCESGGSIRIANHLTVGERSVSTSYGGHAGMTAG